MFYKQKNNNLSNLFFRFIFIGLTAYQISSLSWGGTKDWYTAFGMALESDAPGNPDEVVASLPPPGHRTISCARALTQQAASRSASVVPTASDNPKFRVSRADDPDLYHWLEASNTSTPVPLFSNSGMYTVPPMVGRGLLQALYAEEQQPQRSNANPVTADYNGLYSESIDGINRQGENFLDSRTFNGVRPEHRGYGLIRKVWAHQEEGLNDSSIVFHLESMTKLATLLKNIDNSATSRAWALRAYLRGDDHGRPTTDTRMGIILDALNQFAVHLTRRERAVLASHLETLRTLPQSIESISRLIEVFSRQINRSEAEQITRTPLDILTQGGEFFANSPHGAITINPIDVHALRALFIDRSNGENFNNHQERAFDCMHTVLGFVYPQLARALDVYTHYNRTSGTLSRGTNLPYGSAGSNDWLHLLRFIYSEPRELNKEQLTNLQTLMTEIQGDVRADSDAYQRRFRLTLNNETTLTVHRDAHGNISSISVIQNDPPPFSITE